MKSRISGSLDQKLIKLKNVKIMENSNREISVSWIFLIKKKLIMKNCLPSSCHHIDSRCVIKKPNRKKDLSFFFGLRPDISRSFFSFMFRFSIVFCLVTSMSTVCSTILRNSTVTAHPHKPAAQPLIRRASCSEKKMPPPGEFWYDQC